MLWNIWAGSQRRTNSKLCFRKMNQEHKKYRVPKFQLQRGAQENCRLLAHSNHSSFFSSCFLLEFRLKCLISQVWGREACSTVFQNDVSGKKAQDNNMPSIGSQDTDAQLRTIRQPTRLLADPPQAAGIRPSFQDLQSPASLTMFNSTTFNVFRSSSWNIHIYLCRSSIQKAIVISMWEN